MIYRQALSSSGASRVGKSYRTTYTMRSARYGEATFDVGVVRKYSQGRYGRHGVKWFAYVLLGPIRSPPCDGPDMTFLKY